MLSPRQQQCLQGMGIRLWRLRGATADEAGFEDSIAGTTPVPAAEAGASTPDEPVAAVNHLPTAESTPAIPDAGMADNVLHPPQLQDWEKQEVTRFLQPDASPAPPAEAENRPADTPASKAETRAPATVTETLPKLRDWDTTIAAIHACQACDLAQNCTQKVPGVGDRNADLLIVGEGPGHDEDIRGEPFVGRSGQLLDRMLNAIGISREQARQDAERAEDFFKRKDG